MTQDEKERIDKLVRVYLILPGRYQYELCRLWRFDPSGHSLLQGDTGKYFQEKLKEKGGFTSEISKSLGW